MWLRQSALLTWPPSGAATGPICLSDTLVSVCVRVCVCVCLPAACGWSGGRPCELFGQKSYWLIHLSQLYWLLFSVYCWSFMYCILAVFNYQPPMDCLCDEWVIECLVCCVAGHVWTKHIVIFCKNSTPSRWKKVCWSEAARLWGKRIKCDRKPSWDWRAFKATMNFSNKYLWKKSKFCGFCQQMAVQTTERNTNERSERREVPQTSNRINCQRLHQDQDQGSATAMEKLGDQVLSFMLTRQHTTWPVQLSFV